MSDEVQDLRQLVATLRADLKREMERNHELRVKLPEWASVEDRLPKLGESIWVWWLDGQGEVVKVTHWQPLPAAPGKTEEGNG